MKRSRYVPMIPMMPETRKRIATAMHMAADGMVLAPSSTMATEAARLLAIMAAAIDWGSSVGINERTDPASRAIVDAVAAMERVEARHDDIGAWGVTGSDAIILRAAAARFDEALRRIPFNVYKAAQLLVEQALANAPARPAETTNHERIA